ncbi:PREDICTED: prefoldin subunit 3-like [Rhagoletis zephyria]|uniref:prefoldin subunit 3-like n=1 Tax=Rhagoletis zephyria TaxID=28612 RepID=UPI0008119C2D|nr:PREDICTED: prefoldin subunit 3-like [Rhagoletis zephyria]
MSTEKPKNTLGIPVAEFLEDVDDFMSKQTGTATEVLKAMDELRLKYKYMEQSQLAKKSKLNNQVPDIQNNLEVLRTLKDKYEKKADFETSYLLDSHVYSRAQITPGNTVGLWLGANVMLEYPIEEAMSLLSKNLENAKKNLKQVELDLDFIKEQTTTTEVNLARIYNWDVRKRQSASPEDSANAAAEQSNE